MNGTVHQVYHGDLSAASPGGTVVLEAEESRHLLKALRARPGEGVRAFDGTGRYAEGVLLKAGRRDAVIRIESTGVANSGPERFLGLGLLKGKALDEAVRVGTVLGVTRIYFLDTQQGDVRFDDETRAEARIAGLSRTAVEACKQSGRLVVPTLEGVGKLDDFLGMLPKAGTRMVASLESGSRPLAEVVGDSGEGEAIVLAIGPAGDFSAGEYGRLREAGFLAVTLGEVVLKAELAVAYVFSVVDAVLRCRTGGRMGFRA